MKKTMPLVIVVLGLQYAGGPASAASLKSEVKVETLLQKAMAPEAITISDDGHQISFIARSLNDFQNAPPTTAWIMRKKNGVWGEPQQIPIRGMITSVSFANHDRWLVLTRSRGTIQGYLKILKYAFEDKEKIGNLEDFDHTIEIVDAQNPRRILQTLHPRDVGLSRPEMLKHARVSPDGKWLAFYTHGYEEQRGIHVYNLQTRQAYQMGLFDDKHPTWTPDGSKILFHFQSGGDSFTNPGGEEKSQIGYYDLDISGNDLRATRVLMDTNPEGYVYQKHPSVYPGTDLLFFHSASGPGKAKKLHVRRLRPDSKIYVVRDLISGSADIKSAKHANSSSVSRSGLFFVGKSKGAPTSEFREKQESGEVNEILPANDLKDIEWISDEEIQHMDALIKK